MYTESFVLPSQTGGWGTPIDPMERHRDGDQWWLPGGDGQDRKEGRAGPFVRTETELTQLRDMARIIAKSNPFGINIVDTIVDFVVGEGMAATVMSKEEADKKLVQEAQNVVDELYSEISFEELQQELVDRAVVDGEYFLRYFPRDDAWRTVEPEQVAQPMGSPDKEYLFGVHTPAGDVAGDARGYAVWYDTPDDWEEVPATELLHCKRNVYRSTRRGLSDFFALPEALDGAVRLIRNMREGGAVQSAIAWIEQYESASQSAVDGAKRVNRDFQRPNQYGRTLNHQRFAPGTIPLIPKGKSYLPAPAAINAAAHAGLVQVVLRSICVRWGMPEYFSGDASNANYSSTLVAGSPFVRRAKRWQRFFRTRFLEIIWVALRVAHDSGRFGSIGWERFCCLIDVQLEAPTPELANALQDAQVDQIDMQAGVLSRKTRRLKRGLDDEQERQSLAEEPPIAPPAAPQQGGGAGAFFPRLSLGG